LLNDFTGNHDSNNNNNCENDNFKDASGKLFVQSTKTKLLIKRLQYITQNFPNDKILIFSQFTSMLDICEKPLNKFGFSYLRYDGLLKRNERQHVLNEFNNNPNTKILLMSLRCASIGLNLSVANRVIFLDLWWNPAIESQAIDRVHRIGQKKKSVC